jgi:hypothetical protein
MAEQYLIRGILRVNGAPKLVFHRVVDCAIEAKKIWQTIADNAAPETIVTCYRGVKMVACRTITTKWEKITG